jgi:hypothetical protein
MRRQSRAWPQYQARFWTNYWQGDLPDEQDDGEDADA